MPTRAGLNARVDRLLDRAETRIVEMHCIVLNRFDDDLTDDEQREAWKLARLAQRDITAARKVMANA